MAEAFPLSWRINSLEVDICFLVPKFYLPAHIKSCQQSFSFNYAKSVGWTDGEAPERRWSDLNSLTYSTREMGYGACQDTIEDYLGDWN
jgi:Kyakuja-Dileera-Zisupton transposase